jgi:SAM-dependent methyltransferase
LVDHPGQIIGLTSQDVDYGNWTDERWEKLDHFIALCPTHLRYTQSKYSKYAHKVRQGFNGIRSDLIRRIEAEGIPERNPRRVFFGSSPDRGLIPLLKIWPRVREWVHDAELFACYGVDNIKKIIASNPPTSHWRKLAEEIEKLSNQPGVTWLGRIGQPEQYRQIMQCGLSVHATQFQETGFISGLQEMAMGAIPIICPTWAAGDYCQHGIWIYGDPNDPLTQARFIGEIYRLMSNVALQEKIRAEMVPYARALFNWERFVDVLEAGMHGYADQPGRNISAQFAFVLKHCKMFPGRVLNVGCCDDGGKLREMGAVNIDLYEEDAHLKKPNAVNVLADARQLPQPFQPHIWDTVVASDMLEHYATEDVPDQLRKFKECLAPGGRIIFTVPDDRRSVGATGPTRYGHHHACPPEVIDSWLEQAGLKAIVRYPIDYGFDNIMGEGVVSVPREDAPEIIQDTKPVKPARSVVFLDYDPENKMQEMRLKVRESLIKTVGGAEFIPVVNVKGWSKAMNQGLSQAHGDWIYVVANDILIQDPFWMDKLAVPDTVTAWAGRPFTLTGELDLEFSMVCIPRSVYEKVGGIDEVFADGWGYDDDDFLHRVRSAGFKTKIIPIAARHWESQTLKAYQSTEEAEAKLIHNREIFKSMHPEAEPVGGWLL